MSLNAWILIGLIIDWEIFSKFFWQYPRKNVKLIYDSCLTCMENHGRLCPGLLACGFSSAHARGRSIAEISNTIPCEAALFCHQESWQDRGIHRTLTKGAIGSREVGYVYQLMYVSELFVLCTWYGKICCSHNDQYWIERDTLLVLKVRSSPTTSTRFSSTNGTPTLFWATKVNHYLKVSSLLTNLLITTNEKSAT